MAKDQPSPNASNATIAVAEAYAIECGPIGNVNGNRVRVSGPKLANLRKLEVALADKRKKSKSASKDLAQAESSSKKLLELLDDRGLEMVQLKTDKTGAVAEVILLKKLHKTELKAEKERKNKEVQAKSNIIKGLKATKKTDKLKKQCETLGKLHSNLVSSDFELSATHVAVINVKGQLLAMSKVQVRKLKHLKPAGEEAKALY
jgi:hypothetical protein